MTTDSNKVRVVIDTNVFISAFNFGGKPNDVLNLFRRGRIKVYISPFILEELERILRKRFDWGKREIERVLALIMKKTIPVRPEVRISVIKEKDDDNRLLECAVEAKAQYLVSGDKRHLLPLKEYEGIKILSPAAFLELWFRRGQGI